MARCLLALIIVLTLSIPALAEDIAIIKSVQGGTVKIKRSDEILIARQSDNLQADDILITEKKEPCRHHLP